ncbi:hypothetical protein [Nocardioides coralli]|uniref:hypothetical protein n=1 Tax=Nocardioides coralli TaxID=2872154 RepID=UPI001CA3F0E2|nr:hypothetical protein [Nocardioides coralli]QZY29370.1 hypothetical protein K6T13_01265 [Nocardioides coralli]
MSERPPARVRVTGPTRRPTSRVPAPRRDHIDAETRLGEIYLSSLVREQLRLAALSLLALGLVAALPVLFWLAPGLGEVRWFGVPLPWWVLGFAVYPFLVLIGWSYVRAAERNEDDFVDLVETTEPR